MRTALLFGLLGVIASTAAETSFASAQTTTAVLNSGPMNRSTALLFSDGAKLYALVSESALALHEGEQEPSHFIEAASLSLRLEVKPLAIDWGLGLALLEAQELPQALASLRLPEVISAPRPGLPTQIQSAMKAYTSYIISPRTDRHAIPLLERAIELYGEEVPFEVAGSPILAADGSWIGVASAQALQLSPGGPTLLVEREMGAPLAKHWIAIPAPEVNAWVKSVLEGKFRAAYTQLGKTSVLSGGLTFTEDCPSVSRSNRDNTGEYPIGGADGAGIGGSYSSGRACKILIGKAQGNASPFALPRLQKWHDQMLNALERNFKPELWYSVRREPAIGSIDVWTFGSLREFFRDLQDPTLEPAAIVWDLVTQLPGIHPSDRVLRNAAAELLRLVQKRIQESTPLTVDAGRLLTRISVVARILESESFAILSSTDLRKLADRNGPDYSAWAIVEWNSPASGQLLPNVLLQAADILDAKK